MLRINQCKNSPASLTRGDIDADAPGVWRQPVSDQLFPRDTAIGRFVQTSTRSGDWRICAPWWSVNVPKRRVYSARIVWIEAQIDGAGALIFVEDFGPCRPTVG